MSTTIATGRVLQVNESQGGVPKLPVDQAWVNRFGLEGDKHREYTVHGGPHRAVCLFGMEVIERLQAEGHPIEAGGTGENLTTRGIDWSLLPVGAVVRIGSELELELASPTTPCATQTDNFSDGNFNRILIDRHPADSRMYARVLREGQVAAGSEIVVLAPPDSRAVDELTLRWLDRAEGRSSLASWRAAHAAGFAIDIFDDGEVVMASSDELPGPAFNQASGLAGLPNLFSLAFDFFDKHHTRGWIWAAEEPWPGAEPDFNLGMYGAAPALIADIAAPRGVVIRPIGAGEIDQFNAVTSGEDTPGGIDAGGPNPWPAVYEHMARSHARQLFIAEMDGVPVASASQHISAKVGWMRGATVAPHARGRGIQRALIATRARAAANAGCTLVGASAEPGLVSGRNLEQSGMRLLGTRSAFIYEPK